jgi:hypothetical protein
MNTAESHPTFHFANMSEQVLLTLFPTSSDLLKFILTGVAGDNINSVGSALQVKKDKEKEKVSTAVFLPPRGGCLANPHSFVFPLLCVFSPQATDTKQKVEEKKEEKKVDDTEEVMEEEDGDLFSFDSGETYVFACVAFVLSPSFSVVSSLLSLFFFSFLSFLFPSPTSFLLVVLLIALSAICSTKK